MADSTFVPELEIQEVVANTCDDINPLSQNSLAFQQLMNRLHSALDFDQLILTFINEVRRVLPCDGIEYRNDRIKLYYSDGVSAQNSCKYELRYGEEFLGDVHFSREISFQENELVKVEIMLSGLVPPLRNALRYQQAVRFSQRDELTGLRNGSYYHDSVETEIKRAHRYQIPFSLLLIGLDNFREINKKFGHAAGDAVLVEIARRTERASRNSDIVFRNSGDRFLVFLPNTGIEEASTIAERLKQQVLAKTCIYKNLDIHLTLSIGVVTVSQKDTRYKLTDRADRALFHAKMLGKDRIHVDALFECLQED